MIHHCTPIIAATLSIQLARIQAASDENGLRARGASSLCLKLRSVFLDSHHALVNTMLNGIKDSLVSAPSTAIVGKSQSSLSDKLQSKASRKKPSPASTNPTNRRFGTAKSTRYSKAPTSPTAELPSLRFPMRTMNTAVQV